MFSRSALRTLLRRLAPAAVAAGVLWYAGLADVWSRAASTLAERIVRAAESPARTFLVRDGKYVVPERADLPEGERRAILPSAATWSLVVLLALIFATPRVTSGRGAAGAAVAAGLLLVSHALHLALKVGTLYATAYGDWSTGHVSSVRREALATGGYFFDVALVYALPFVFWAVSVAFPLGFTAEDEAAPRGRGGKGKRREGRV